MGFRLPKMIHDLLMNLGIAVLLLGAYLARSVSLYADLGLPPYTGFLIMAVGALMLFLAYILPYGTASSNRQRLGAGDPPRYFRGQLEIVTDPHPAFRMNGAAYELHKPAEPFFASFGAPDWMDDSDAAYAGWNAEHLSRDEFKQMYTAYTTAYFYAAGAEVRVDGYGLIKSVTFYPQGCKVDDMELYKADFRTSLGITGDSRPEDIVKAYGRPSSRHTDTKPNVLGQMDDNLRYRFGDEVLQFGYTDGKFCSVCLYWDPGKVFN